MAAQIQITAGVPAPSSIEWAGGEGSIRIAGDWAGDGVIRVEYKDAEDSTWTPFQDDEFKDLLFGRNGGFTFKLDAVSIRAAVVRGLPTVSIHVNEIQ